MPRIPRCAALLTGLVLLHASGASAASIAGLFTSRITLSGAGPTHR